MTRTVINVRITRAVLLVALLVVTATPIAAKPAKRDSANRINMALSDYNRLLSKARETSTDGPVRYSLSKAKVNISASIVADAVSAEVVVALDVDVYADRPMTVPILAPGTPVSKVVVDEAQAQLVSTGAGLAWSVSSSGSYAMVLKYRVDARRDARGYHLAVPVPRAAVTSVSATLPGRELAAAIIPAVGFNSSSSGDTTTVRATVPSTSGIQISWVLGSKYKVAVSRASYRGRVVSDALVLNGELMVDLLTAGSVTLPLLPSTTVLKKAAVDGKAASIVVEDEHFALLIKGRGSHRVNFAFEVPVVRKGGPPQARITIPPVPVSRFELLLPGKKEVSVEPGEEKSEHAWRAPVTHATRAARTIATFNVPLTASVAVRWSEAVPQKAQTELRSNAELYHVARAEEGVLHLKATVVYQVSRGQTNKVVVQLPTAAQVNRVSAENGAVTDWRTARPTRGKPQQVTVFFDRQLSGKLLFEVVYEVLGVEQNSAPVAIPMLQVMETDRQRGMVALLATKELALKPVGEKRISRVGENQLPAFVRQQLKQTIAHTYKYSDPGPSLTVEATAAERKPGKVAAQVDTLVSLADVALQGSARVEVNVKSGTISDLQLKLPSDVNLLSLSAPSLRIYKSRQQGKQQTIDLQFTQEMEGQFKVDVLYERILADGDNTVVVPTLAVLGAEVEQGRIAVEALAAVEVQPAATDQLSSLDVSELPRQLVLKTTNPILLAYKYAHVKPPYRLALQVTRHRVLGVKAATIDKGHYQTLFTRDGLAVTRARFTVRNTRKQFLKVELPPRSEVWAAFVNGQPVKPALAKKQTKKQTPQSVLIKIINSAAGFPVELIYATRCDDISGLGTLAGRLPRPDTVVTQTVWDVYVPEGLSYRQPETNMKLELQAARVTESAMPKLDAKRGKSAALRITVPVSGVHYRFSKLYANQADDPPSFRLPYASRQGALISGSLSVAGTLAVWLGLFLFLRRRDALASGTRPAFVSAGVGMTLLIVTLGTLGRSIMTPAIVSALVLLGVVGKRVWNRRQRARAWAALEAETKAVSELTEPAANPDPHEETTAQSQADGDYPSS